MRKGIHKGKGNPSFYVSPSLMEQMKETGEENSELRSFMDDVVEAYKVNLEEGYLPLFEPLRGSLHHYVKYFDPLMKKDLSFVRPKDLESAALGVKKFTEIIVGIGETFNLSESDKELNPAKRFEDRIKRLDDNYDNWIPRNLCINGVNGMKFKELEFHIKRDLMRSKEFEDKNLKQFKAAEESTPLFDSDALHEGYRLSSNMLHYSGPGFDKFYQQANDLVKVAKHLKEVEDKIDRASLFYINNVSPREEIVGMIGSLGDGQQYYYRWLISADMPDFKENK